MRRFINLTILALCMMALVTGVAAETTGGNFFYNQGAKYVEAFVGAKRERKIDYIQVAEDIEIMARIVDRTLKGKFPDEYKANSLFRESRGCQGIYLKGYGAVFMTSISFPVAELKAPQEKVAPDDLWQRTKYELRGVSRGVSTYSFANRGASGSYDSEKVERLKEELLKLIGTYASNIRQLRSQENVVIAVRGTPGQSLLSTSRLRLRTEDLKRQSEQLMEKAEQLKGELQSVPLPPSGVTMGKTISAPELVVVTPKVVADLSGKVLELNKKLRETVVTIPDSGMVQVFAMDKGARSRTTLIVKVNKESIMAYKDGKLDLTELTKQAEITQY